MKVTTVDGPVELKIPAGTQPGTTLLMAKRGVPRLGASNQVRGNHNVSREAMQEGEGMWGFALGLTATAGMRLWLRAAPAGTCCWIPSHIVI